MRETEGWEEAEITRGVPEGGPPAGGGPPPPGAGGGLELMTLPGEKIP